MSRPPRFRAWCATLNNPDPVSDPRDDPRTWETEFLSFQEERGAGTLENPAGTRHYQIYFILKNAKTLRALKKFNPRANFDERRGTHEQALAYVNKEETRIDGPWTTGTPPEQGKRNDLILCIEGVKDGATDEELIERYPSTWARNYRALREIRTLKQNKRNKKTFVTVFYGPPGTGKSRYCNENYPGAYWKPSGIQWDLYSNEKDVIIDEFYGWLPWGFLLKLLDRYPLILPDIKFGKAQFNSERIFICTNADPESWYPNMGYSALSRRIDVIIYVDLEGIPHVKKGSDLEVVLEYPFQGYFSSLHPSYREGAIPVPSRKTYLQGSGTPPVEETQSSSSSGRSDIVLSSSISSFTREPEDAPDGGSVVSGDGFRIGQGERGPILEISQEYQDYGARSRLLTGDTYFPERRVVQSISQGTSKEKSRPVRPVVPGRGILEFFK